MKKIFTALNKELAKFFPLSFDYLLTFRTLKVQCFQGVSDSHQEGVGIYVPPTHISRFYCHMSRNFEAKIYATLNKEKRLKKSSKYDIIFAEVSKLRGRFKWENNTDENLNN